MRALAGACGALLTCLGRWQTSACGGLSAAAELGAVKRALRISGAECAEAKKNHSGH